MKLNWGTGIAIVYSAFVIIMVSLVVYSKNIDHTLVMDNYYEEDLKYQGHIDKVNNSRTLANDLEISVLEPDRLLRLQFPVAVSAVSGNVLFYRADDKGKDFSVNIAVNEKGEMNVPTDKLLPGKWKVQVDWKGDGTDYFKEKVIVL